MNDRAGLPSPDAAAAAPLHIEVDGWEGPLDLLLDLARRQRVDLRRISVLDLVNQYLDFVARAGAERLELAADYLVMAAWLAYLKSALLLPREEQPDPDPEEIAAQLHLRLRRLGAMREAAARLMAGDRLGRDVFVRGTPEGLRLKRHSTLQCEWFDLVQAYAQVKARTAPAIHVVHDRMVVTLESALARVQAMLGTGLNWRALVEFLPDELRDGRGGDPRLRRSALASSFVAALELARLGRAELAQVETFGTLLLRPIAA